MDEDGEVDTVIECIAKVDRAHNRPIVGIWSFRFGGQIGFITVAHDNAKLWTLDENRETQNVDIVEKMTLAKWNTSVQSSAVSSDGKLLIVIGIDSKIQEIILDKDVQQRSHDFGYMEAVHVAISNNNSYITTSYTNGFNEIDIEQGNTTRKSDVNSVKAISCIKFSNDRKYIAAGYNDGVIEFYDYNTLRAVHKYEVHSMKIRKIEFLPGNDKFLSACDDRLIKMNSIADINDDASLSRTMKAIRTFAAHNSPVLNITVDERSGGTRFASSAVSGEILMWHIELTTPICSIANEHKSMIHGLSFSPTGRHLLSIGEDMKVCCYRVPPSGDQSPLHIQEEEEEEQMEEAEQRETADDGYYNPEENFTEKVVVEEKPSFYYAGGMSTEAN